MTRRPAAGTFCVPCDLWSSPCGWRGTRAGPALQLKDVKLTGDAYVTASARPEFLRVGSGGGGYMDFTDYNAPFTVTPPPAAQTVDGASYNF